MYEQQVRVRRDWLDQRVISVPVSALFDFQIRKISGGKEVRSPYPMLYAVMYCTYIPAGAIFAHSCNHGPPPHEILVCITQKDNDKNLYRKLRENARIGDDLLNP